MRSFSRQSILSTFVLSIGLVVTLPHNFVSAQATGTGSTTGSDRTTESSPSPNSSPSPGASSSPSSSPSPESEQFKPRSYREPSSYRRSPRPSVDSGTSGAVEKVAGDIRGLVSSNQQVRQMCAEIGGEIEFEVETDRLRINTGNHQCSYEIVEEVLEPQLDEGKIRTYEFSGDREDLIVSF